MFVYCIYLFSFEYVYGYPVAKFLCSYICIYTVYTYRNFIPRYIYIRACAYIMFIFTYKQMVASLYIKGLQKTILTSEQLGITTHRHVRPVGAYYPLPLALLRIKLCTVWYPRKCDVFSWVNYDRFFRCEIVKFPGF